MTDDHHQHITNRWVRSETTHVDHEAWGCGARGCTATHHPDDRHVVWEDPASGNAVLLLDAPTADQRRLLWRSRTGAVRDMSSYAFGLPDRTSVIAAVDVALTGNQDEIGRFE